MSVRQRIAIHWGISSFLGWGVYGLNLALAWAQDAEIEPICSMPLEPREIVVDPLRRQALAPVLMASAAFQSALKPHAGTRIAVDFPMLAGLGARFELTTAAHGVAMTGAPTIGVTFFETAHLSAEDVRRASAFPMVVAGSTWNAQVLRDHGLQNVTTVLQGVDPALFHPAPRAGVLADRFLVFSGGKLEGRKGQDLVVAAFRRFAARHSDALLVSAWHSPWPAAARSLDASAVASPVPFDAQGRVDVPAWARANGIADHQILDLGPIPNAALPQVLREMDVAVFPNRCESGTNLVAMECMACGVPTILSANTGHLDLIEEDNCFALSRQSPVAPGDAGFEAVAGWGEGDVDEVVDALERAYADREGARRMGLMGARTVAPLTWARTAQAMKEIVLSLS